MGKVLTCSFCWGGLALGIGVDDLDWLAHSSKYVFEPSQDWYNLSAAVISSAS